MVDIYVIFKETATFPNWLYHFLFIPAMLELLVVAYPFWHLILSVFFILIICYWRDTGILLWFLFAYSWYLIMPNAFLVLPGHLCTFFCEVPSQIFYPFEKWAKDIYSVCTQIHTHSESKLFVRYMCDEYFLVMDFMNRSLQILLVSHLSIFL